MKAPEWPSLHCFYLNPSLHELGWASKNGFEIKPPQEIVHLNTEEKWKEILAKCLEDPENVLPGDFFQEQAQIPNHTFTTGMKLEAINHKDPSCIVPATVNKNPAISSIRSERPGGQQCEQPLLTSAPLLSPVLDQIDRLDSSVSSLFLFQNPAISSIRSDRQIGQQCEQPLLISEPCYLQY
ncbi:unnamed protein product [Ranitomeya imitator]|uniref:Uncharacterized protein n=1 Tax=Ranitomeya imitator TaxID=111125 RepID=A0ABN9L654_9NEOB|nr:unnamed protein product [Ranitomeya imitator]